MKENVVKDKPFDFALRVVKLAQRKNIIGLGRLRILAGRIGSGRLGSGQRPDR